MIKLKFKIYYLQARTAFTLWRLRLNAGLSIGEASRLLNIDYRILLGFERAQINPPLYLLARMLEFYKADSQTIFFFCRFH